MKVFYKYYKVLNYKYKRSAHIFLYALFTINAWF